MALKVQTNTDNFLFVQTGANEGIEDFLYKDEKLKNKSEIHKNCQKEPLKDLNSNKNIDKKEESNEYNAVKF